MYSLHVCGIKQDSVLISEIRFCIYSFKRPLQPVTARFRYWLHRESLMNQIWKWNVHPHWTSKTYRTYCHCRNTFVAERQLVCWAVTRDSDIVLEGKIPLCNRYVCHYAFISCQFPISMFLLHHIISKLIDLFPCVMLHNEYNSRNSRTTVFFGCTISNCQFCMLSFYLPYLFELRPNFEQNKFITSAANSDNNSAHKENLECLMCLTPWLII